MNHVSVVLRIRPRLSPEPHRLSGRLTGAAGRHREALKETEYIQQLNTTAPERIKGSTRKAS